MPKIPRDISGSLLIKALERIGYLVVRQKGSHITLSKESINRRSKVTIPNHNPIKIGTINSILSLLAENEGISKEELIKKLFP